MSETDRNELWKIIARAECFRKDPDCMHCATRTRCVERAKKAADNIRKVYIITTRNDDSIFKHANLNDIPEAEVTETIPATMAN